MIRSLAHRLGYVPRAQLTDAEEKLREVRQRLDRVTRQLEQATATSERLEQTRRDDLKDFDARTAALAAEHERRLARAIEAAEEKAARRIGTLEERLRDRSVETAAALRRSDDLERRVADSLQDIDAARESLMAIEVKLDILEGAANVLDRRLRAIPPPTSEADAQRRPAEAGRS